MKALKYLLIVVAMVSVLGVQAQTLAQMPKAQMKSTSVMLEIGSTLPQAAKTGVVTTYSPTDNSAMTGPRRTRPGDNDDPYKDPLGDAAWPLLMLAAAYALLRVYKRKRSV